MSLKDNPSISLFVMSLYLRFLLSVTSLYFVLDVPYVFFYDFAVENLKVRFHLTKCLRRVFTLLVLFDGRFRLRKHLLLGSPLSLELPISFRRGFVESYPTLIVLRQYVSPVK